MGVVKHKEPRSLFNNSSFYITTNQLPDFGDENDSVYRRTRGSKPRPFRHQYLGATDGSATTDN